MCFLIFLALVLLSQILFTSLNYSGEKSYFEHQILIELSGNMKVINKHILDHNILELEETRDIKYEPFGLEAQTR